MFMNPGGSLAVWSVEFALAYLMLGIGFWIGRWSLRNRKPSGEENERAVQAAARIQELADRVAQDVGEHSSRVREISTDLSASGRERQSPLDEVVLKSIDDIVKANERLQEQLATAEVRLQRQAAELETQTTVARTDPLTLLSNRRALDDEMNRRLCRMATAQEHVLADHDRRRSFQETER